MWGQDVKAEVATIDGRIIPTRVGTSCTADYGTRQPEDHPHACGDKAIVKRLQPALIGSSPRVWGQDSNIIVAGISLRIIPTRVGTRYVFACG